MQQRPSAIVRIALVVACLVVLTAQAQTRPDAQRREAEGDREAQALLRRTQSAAQRLSYAGTFVYQQGSRIRTSRITHLVEGKNELEKLEVLDGRPREYIRNNEEILCYVPESRTLLIEKRVTHDVFPAILAASPADLAKNYSLRKGLVARIAGHEAQSVILQPRDKLRYGYTLWTDRASGLLLRAQTISDTGEIVEQITFTQLHIGRVERSKVKPSFADTRGWRVENAVMQSVDLSAWTVRGVPPGFVRVRELRRQVSESAGIEGQGKTGTGTTQRQVSQIVFSDGLAAVSVFIESVSQSRADGSVNQGAMNIVGKRYGDFWLTIVGEVPSEAIRQIAESIEYKSGK